MKRILTVTAAVVACFYLRGTAAIDETVMSVTTGSGTVSATNTVIRGTIHEILIDVVTSGSTGNVTVAYVPAISTLSGYNLLSKSSVAADARFLPRFDGCDNAGTGLTSDPPWPATICSGSIVFSVASANATNRVFKAVIVYDK